MVHRGPQIFDQSSVEQLIEDQILITGAETLKSTPLQLGPQGLQFFDDSGYLNGSFSHFLRLISARIWKAFGGPKKAHCKKLQVRQNELAVVS